MWPTTGPRHLLISGCMHVTIWPDIRWLCTSRASTVNCVHIVLVCLVNRREMAYISVKRSSREPILVSFAFLNYFILRAIGSCRHFDIRSLFTFAGDEAGSIFDSIDDAMTLRYERSRPNLGTCDIWQCIAVALIYGKERPVYSKFVSECTAVDESYTLRINSRAIEVFACLAI